MKTPLVSVIIVNWNGEKVIEKCLRSILNQKYKSIEVIVVDNNSQDASRKIIQQKFKKVILVTSERNLGFTGGNNLGLRYAKGKYVLLFNSDAEATGDFLTILVRYLEKKPKVAVVQPKLIYKGNPGYPDGVINSAGCYFTPTGFLYYLGYGKSASLPLYNIERMIFSAYGASMLIRRSVVSKVGLFDDDFFLYFEETDFCIRVWLLGYEVWYTPKAIVYHSGGFSARKFGTSQIIYHSFKNRFCSYIKTLEGFNLFLVLLFSIPLSELASMLYLVYGKWDLFLSVQKAIMWNVLHLGQTLQKRKNIQTNLRKKKDDEFLPKVTWKARTSYYLYLFKGLQYYKD